VGRTGEGSEDEDEDSDLDVFEEGAAVVDVCVFV
jgi:hypothetical protein